MPIFAADGRPAERTLSSDDELAHRPTGSGRRSLHLGRSRTQHLQGGRWGWCERARVCARSSRRSVLSRRIAMWPSVLSPGRWAPGALGKSSSLAAPNQANRRPAAGDLRNVAHKLPPLRFRDDDEHPFARNWTPSSAPASRRCERPNPDGFLPCPQPGFMARATGGAGGSSSSRLGCWLSSSRASVLFCIPRMRGAESSGKALGKRSSPLAQVKVELGELVGWDCGRQRARKTERVGRVDHKAQGGRGCELIESRKPGASVCLAGAASCEMGARARTHPARAVGERVLLN